MAADPTLADLLDEDADAIADRAPWQKYQRDADEIIERAERVRAAAVRLRKLDAIEEAIGDVDRLRVVQRSLVVNPAMLAQSAHDILRRIADALGGTE